MSFRDAPAFVAISSGGKQNLRAGKRTSRLEKRSARDHTAAKVAAKWIAGRIKAEAKRRDLLAGCFGRSGAGHLRLFRLLSSSLHAVPKRANALPEPLPQFRELLRSENK